MKLNRGFFTAAILLLICVTHIDCGSNLFSETSVSNLANEFHTYMDNVNTYPSTAALRHSKWEQYIELPDGDKLQIDWIFHSSKTMQDRMASLTCEVVTWVIKVGAKKPLGQISCLWSMSSGHHCSHACQFPLIPSYEYVNYIDLLNALDKTAPVLSYVISHSVDSSMANNGVFDGDSVLASLHSPQQKDTFTLEERMVAEDPAWTGTGDGDATSRRHLRTYSDSDEWTPLSSNKLTSFNGVTNENFGSSVSISGDYMAVGAIGTNDYAGRVLIYQRLGVDIWKQEYFPLLGNADYSNDFFGWCVSLSGDAVAVGAYQTMHQHEDQRTAVGAVYIYLRVSAGWIEEAFLQVERDENKNGKNDNKNDKNDQLVYDHFGWSVSLHQSTLLVGAYGDNTAGTSAGAAYVYDRHNHAIYGWSYSQKLLPAEGTEYAAFGWSVALYQNVSVVGAYGHSSGDFVFNGAVYLFQRIGASSSASSSSNSEENGRLQSWTQTTLLLPADGGNNDYFGWDVSLWRNLLAVGSRDWASQDTDETPTGAVYTYATNVVESIDRYITTIYQWHLDQKIVPKDSTTRYFGNCIAMSDQTLLIGSFGDEFSVAEAGQAFIYTAMAADDLKSSTRMDEEEVADVVERVEQDGEGSSGSTRQPLYRWTHVATLIPNTTEIGIDFGFSVDIDLVTAVVGAVRADGRATDSGAAFVFIMQNTKFEYPLSERTYLALVSFLPIFFLTIFCIIGSTSMICMSLKTNSTFLSLVDWADEGVEDNEEEDSDNEEDYEDADFSSHSSSTMDSSVYSETELISPRHQQYNIA